MCPESLEVFVLRVDVQGPVEHLLNFGEKLLVGRFSEEVHDRDDDARVEDDGRPGDGYRMSRFITNLNHDSDHSLMSMFFLLCPSIASKMVITAAVSPTLLVLFLVLEINSDFVFDDRLDLDRFTVDDVAGVVDDSDRNVQNLLEAQKDFGLHQLDQVAEAEHEHEDFVVSKVSAEETLIWLGTHRSYR